eukprot:c1625_g1_i1.p1 GENE.c1625_g1_i1~~c1625_g1_i1.p1  ORF type:complete len:226 (-),score=52.04 c1625_g1_i1:158-835(-)
MDPGNFVPYAINVARGAQHAATTMQARFRPAEFVGKNFAKKFRAVGWTPAVIVNAPKINFCVSQYDIVKQYQIPSWTTRLIDLVDENDQKVERVLMREIAWHPVREAPYNVNFLRYNPTPEKAIKVNVPVEIEGIQRCEALKLGAYVNLTAKFIPVYTYLDPIPASIVINVADMKMRQTVRLSDLVNNGALPKGMWPAVKGSHCNEARAPENPLEDMVVLRIAKI